jgi:hypothetical protein
MRITVTTEEPLGTQAIAKELKHERERLNIAIAALDETELPLTPHMSSSAAKLATSPPQKGLTPEGRKRLSDMMKKRWAGKGKKASRDR